MVEHPLEEGERFTIYDGVGRPTAWFTGGLARLPVVMPISEEIAWPPELGPDAAARLIYAEDRPRAEALVRRSYGLDGLDRGDTAVYSALLAGPLLRRLAAWGRPIPQLELLALALVIGASGLALLGSRLGLVIGGGALLLGVEVARQIPALRRLRGGDEPALIGEVAIRPLGHGAYTAALTFGMVAVDARSEVADLVLLGLGGAAVFFSLVQARALLRRQAGGLGLPSPAGLAERLGIRWPVRWRIPLVIELAAWVAGLLGLGFVWGVMVAAGLARLWRWFVAPVAESPDVERRSGAIAVEVAERGRR